MFRRLFSVFVQYFRRVLKYVDNEQVRKPAICDVFVCKHLTDSRSSFGQTRGKQGKIPLVFLLSRISLKEDETFCKKAKTRQK